MEPFLIYKLLTPPINWGSKPTCPERIARAQIKARDDFL